jgi:hypothetical protein
MSVYEHNLDGDIVINNEIEISLADIINALYEDPRFVRMVRLLMTETARAMGNTLGTTAQRPPRPTTVQPNTVQRTW